MRIRSSTAGAMTMIAVVGLLGGACKRDEPESRSSPSAAPPAATGDAERPAVPIAPLPSDAEITAAVTAQLIEDHAFDAKRVMVDTQNGIVALTGKVDDLLSRDRAARVAEAVRGVRSVSNRIEVEAPQRTDDALARDVRDMLLFDAAADGYEIDVKARDGTVTLTGTVQSWQEKDLAERIAKAVRGVRDVRNELLVEYKTARSDAEIDKDVESRLRWDVLVGDGLIDVNVKDGRVDLSGRVASAAERTRAFRQAWVVGTRAVDVTGLRVDPTVKDEDVRRLDFTGKSDAEIAAAIRDATLYDPRVSSFDVKVDVKSGRAILSGKVDNAKARLAAEALARNTVGVRDVDNRLTIETADGGATDDQIERRITAALVANPITDSYQVGVSVDGGKAKLTGTVDNQYERAKAADVASGVAGVKTVDNQLSVSRPSAAFVYSPYLGPYEPYVETWYYGATTAVRPDSEIRDEIVEEMKWSPFVDADQVQVSVRDGRAMLSGTVDSWQERQAATENALEGGATVVQNELLIRGS